MATTDKMGRYADWAFKIVSTLIIPLVGYVMILHSTIAVQEEKLSTTASAVKELKEEIKQIGDNEIALVRLEGRVETANGKLDEIKTALSNLR